MSRIERYFGVSFNIQILIVMFTMEKQHICNAELSFINWIDTDSGMLR